MNIDDYGYNDFWTNKEYDKNLIGRVIGEGNGKIFTLITSQGIKIGHVTGKLFYNDKIPVIGDWVCITFSGDTCLILDILERKSILARQKSGITKLEKQIIAVNIDKVYLVTGLDDNFSERRIERFLALIRSSGALPIIILNKIDLCDNIDFYLKKVKKITNANDIQVFCLSCLEETGLSQLKNSLNPSETVCFVGASGVGKSTIINKLLGFEKQRTQTINPKTAKGKHTTTSKGLFLMNNGSLLIDTPGIREIHSLANEKEILDIFPDIERLILTCKFNDCKHTNEPNCAVLEAIKNGKLSLERYNNYCKLQREAKNITWQQYVKEKLQQNRANKSQNKKKHLYNKSWEQDF